MLRTHNCGELRIEHVNQTTTLCGWVQKSRDMGGMTFLDLRDRYGITQISFNMERDVDICASARQLGREFVVKITGRVIERESKNKNIPTGEIEIEAQSLEVLNASKTPPFTIETDTDGGEELRMQYRYLDLRRKPLQQNLKVRHQLALETRKYLDAQAFIEVETPFLIKSTPEGARDFVVPSRMHGGEFYALPQSPQTFKQLLMVGGYDRYFQIVKCFRDEDLRADRQPEFTQIDCEMSFVERDDVLNTFEGLTKHIFKTLKGIDLPDFPHMEYAEAFDKYGNDKPDTRFEMTIQSMESVTQNLGFVVFDKADSVAGIVAKGAASFTRKQLDALTDFVKRPQVGATGLIYCKVNDDGTFKSSADKFFDQEKLAAWVEHSGAAKGDLILIMAGEYRKTREQLSALRLHLGDLLDLRDPKQFNPLWVVNFPLVEWDEDSKRFHAMHHPFTSPLAKDFDKLNDDPGSVRANAYDLVINGVELGGGSIRIHDKEVQARMFEVLGFTPEEAQKQFGFLMNAFEYGAPPHGGIAFGFDRLAAMLGGQDSIRDFIAFPKNNAGRDVMIDSPSSIASEQLDELGLDLKATE